jgi:hypothetical protein
MTPEVLSSYPEIQKLHVAEVVRYLQENHPLTQAIMEPLKSQRNQPYGSPTAPI